MNTQIHRVRNSAVVVINLLDKSFIGFPFTFLNKNDSVHSQIQAPQTKRSFKEDEILGQNQDSDPSQNVQKQLPTLSLFKTNSNFQSKTNEDFEKPQPEVDIIPKVKIGNFIDPILSKEKTCIENESEQKSFDKEPVQIQTKTVAIGAAEDEGIGPQEHEDPVSAVPLLNHVADDDHERSLEDESDTLEKMLKLEESEVDSVETDQQAQISTSSSDDFDIDASSDVSSSDSNASEIYPLEAIQPDFKDPLQLDKISAYIEVSPIDLSNTCRIELPT